MIEKLVKANLGSDGIVPFIKITQGDDMWRFRFQLFLENKRWTIPSGSRIILSGKKPDGHVFDLPCVIENNEAYADCTKQLTAVAGVSNAKLQVFDSNGRLVNSCKITFSCAEDVKGDGIVSSSDLSAYERFLEDVGEIIGQSGDMLEYHVVYTDES